MAAFLDQDSAWRSSALDALKLNWPAYDLEEPEEIVLIIAEQNRLRMLSPVEAVETWLAGG